jgi:RNA polymerase sigma-70 factor, ECF subfamily
LSNEDLAKALAAAVRGDDIAYGLLWRTLHPALLRYLRVVVGDTAEDVASETWLQVVRDLDRFTGDAGAFRVWLFRVARNRGIDELRRAGRRREQPRDSIEPGALPGARSHPGSGTGFDLCSPDAAAEAAERAETEWAIRLISTLPPDQAEAVMLRVVAGLDVAQTAQVLSKRPGAVRIAAMRGLRRLASHAEVQARQQVRTRPAATPGVIRPEGV